MRQKRSFLKNIFVPSLMITQVMQSTISAPGTLEFRLNEEIPANHYGLLAATLNEWWGWLIQADSGIMERRVQSGTPFISAYDSRQISDFVTGINLAEYGPEIPVVSLEMTFLETGGDKGKVPKLYKSLTHDGLWSPIPKSYDTVIFVDLTGMPSRIGKNGNGEVERTVKFGKAYVLGQTDHELPFDPEKIKHIWTYSPDIDGIIRMHIRYGASDTNHAIPDARNPFLNNLRGLTEEEFTAQYPHHNAKLHNTRLMSYLG